jgi:hypothetical protein
MTKPTTTATAKRKAIRMPGKERPAASRLGIQGPPPPEPHPRNTGKNTNPPTVSPSGQLQRVSITNSFGASPVSSAMDHSARRDTGRVKPQYQTPLRGLNPKPCKRTLQQGKTITSSANPVGRF